MKKSISVYWARRDIRIKDNPALTAACHHAKDQDTLFLPIYILEDYMCAHNPEYQFGMPSRVFLSRALPHFSKRFKEFALIQGKPTKVFAYLSKIYDITVFVNEDVHPDFYAQLEKLKKANISVKLYKDALTISKETVTGTGNIYSVFTPFKKSVWDEFVKATPLVHASIDAVTYISKKDITSIPGCLTIREDVLRSALTDIKVFRAGDTIYDIDTISQEKIKYDSWYYTEEDALHRFTNYIQKHIRTYKKDRDSLELEGTSKMSLGLAWGLVSARTLVHMIKAHTKSKLLLYDEGESEEGVLHFISELIWREFYRYLYYHNPKLIHQEFQEKFRKKIVWVRDDIAQARFLSWMRGETGYPIVDAAMHELATTGWMHNRARMIVASVLTKNLGVDWRWGQEYFRAMLIDLDESSNNGGWQWAASVGADPKPIRIFNPYLQAENYDSHKVYQHKYLPKEYFSHPPQVIIEHKEARKEALRRYGLDESVHGLARDY